MKLKEQIKKNITKAAKALIITGVLILVLGIVAIIYPASSGRIATATMGIILIVGSLFRLGFAIFSVSMGTMLLRYLLGILMLLAGVWLVANPDPGMEILTFILAAYFIADGVLAIFYSFSLRPIGGGWYLLFSGIISIALGVLIFANWPQSGNVVLGIYIGIKLVLEGLTQVLTGTAIRKAIDSISARLNIQPTDPSVGNGT